MSRITPLITCDISQPQIYHIISIFVFKHWRKKIPLVLCRQQIRIDKTRVLSKEDKENKMQKEKMMQSYVTIKVVVQLVNALAPRHH